MKRNDRRIRGVPLFTHDDSAILTVIRVEGWWEGRHDSSAYVCTRRGEEINTFMTDEAGANRVPGTQPTTGRPL